jgi:hypothetical protein
VIVISWIWLPRRGFSFRSVSKRFPLRHQNPLCLIIHILVIACLDLNCDIYLFSVFSIGIRVGTLCLD